MKTLLSTTDWAHLQEVFDVAVNLDGDERAIYLDGVCAETPDLRTRVDSLLAAIEQETSVGPLLEAAASSTVEHNLPAVGGHLGHYRISGVIGQGGMGIVYRAVRADDEYQKEVAIKVATIWQLTPDLRQRFLAERQILADLDHPNISRLLDGGTTPEGIPYVVMELVDGQPIDAYCQAAGLDMRRKIELMIAVARSVDFAHRHLVVHRDIKPENVYVTADGVPKLLDFGIAKALNPEASGIGVAATADAARLMTPEYASPEQVLGQAITTATDVYQLGILLYLLLTGRRPFQASGEGLGILEKNICETPPPRPGINPDVDRILLQALEKDPRRRYSSAEAFAQDLERYLGGFPVKARASSFAYRASKFAGRHRVGVAAAAIFVLLILGFSIGMTLLAKRLQKERNQAEVQLERSERVSQLLEDVFGGADPDSAQGKLVTARELLDKGTAEVRQTLDKEPEVQAALYATLGHIYDNLGEIDRADELMRHSLSIRRRVYGENSIETAKGLNDEADLLNDKGQHRQSELMAREALAIRERLTGRSSPEVAETLNFLGIAVGAEGHTTEAETLFRRAVSIWDGLPASKQIPEQMLEPLNNLSFMLLALADYPGAEAAARRMLDIARGRLGEDTPTTAQALQMLGSVLNAEGKLDEAGHVLRESLAIRVKVLGPKNMSVGDSEIYLANVLRDEGQYSEAERLYLDVVTIQTAVFGPESERTVQAKNGLASLYNERGELSRAEALFRKSLAIDVKTFGSAAPGVSAIKNDLAGTLIAEGKLTEAKQLLDSALEIDRMSDSGGGLGQADIELNMGRLQLANHQERAGEASYRAALAIYRAKQPPGHPDTAFALERLGDLLLKEGRKREAEPLLAEAVTIRQKTLPAGSAKIRASQEMLAQART